MFILISEEKKRSQPTNHLCEWKQDLIYDYSFLIILASVCGNYTEVSQRERLKKCHIQKATCGDFNKTRFLPVLSFSPPAFERGHCYEPYLQNGNFTTSDPLYGVGAVIQFSCDPGHSLEQGPPVIECISARDPYWNDTEPLCKGNTEDWKQRQCASCNNIFLLLS